MPMTIRVLATIILAGFAFSHAIFAITITVAKNGADFSTISAAIQASQPGDVIKIMDTETYEEQVTIDSTKYPLTLTSKDPTSLTKPTIKYRDTINVGPRNYAESLVDSLSTFDKNGALRIIKAQKVIIDGIAIDGNGVYPFGYPSVWEQRNAYQHGNAAIALFRAGNVIIRNCDIFNAYFGISIKDRNTGGIYFFSNPSDNDTDIYVPMSEFGMTGNHLVERNRIHDNSWGMFFESSWDLGSTIRYNLIYENHHANDSIATQVRKLTDEGPNQPGGAFLFKDVPLSPLAIYNNTFWHNFALFAGHWQAGYQHLVFNNIFGPPNKYWENPSPSFNINAMELTPAMPNRIYNCIFSAQVQAPQENFVRIMDLMPQLQGAGGNPPDPGTLIAGTGGSNPGFPAAANNRWLEMDNSMFLSTDPTSPNFLEPNWADANVNQFIVQQGWQKAGVKNTTGTWADLGAMELAHGSPSFLGTIRPAPLPIIQLSSGSGYGITFIVDPREGATMADLQIKLFRLIKTNYKKATFGSNEKTIIIGASDIIDLTIPTTPPVKVGPNSYSITANITGEFAFIEMIIEATGADGKQFTSAVGFLPYRKLEYIFKVEIRDKTGTSVLYETHVGDTVQLRVIPQKVNGDAFTSPILNVRVTLLSGFPLMDASKNPLAKLEYPNGIPGGPDNKLVVFTKIPEDGIENIVASGIWRNTSTGSFLPWLGGTSIKVLSNQTAIANEKPSSSLKVGRILPHEVTVKCFDLQGRRIFQKTFLSDMGLAFMPRYLQNNITGVAKKIYLIDISVKDRVSLKQTRSVWKIVAR